MGGAIPGLVDLGSIRKQAEQARGNKPVSKIPPWPLHQLLLRITKRHAALEANTRKAKNLLEAYKFEAHI